MVTPIVTEICRHGQRFARRADRSFLQGSDRPVTAIDSAQNTSPPARRTEPAGTTRDPVCYCRCRSEASPATPWPPSISNRLSR